MKTPKLTECVDSVLRCIDSLDDEVIEALISEADSVTRTNCGWQEYQIANIAKNYATYIRDLREAQKVGDSDAWYYPAPKGRHSRERVCKNPLHITIRKSSLLM